MNIERMAVEAGFVIDDKLHGSAWHAVGPSCRKELEKFAELVRKEALMEHDIVEFIDGPVIEYTPGPPLDWEQP